MRIYRGCLIGNPVSQSISHLTHPRIFQEIGVSATYEKRLLEIEQLREFFESKKGSYDWIAVAMPFKVAAIPFMDSLTDDAKNIGSINTIYCRDGTYVGDNNDGVACLDAIEQRIKVNGKRFVVLGAGGVARAIAYEAAKRKARVVIVNRTIANGVNLAKELGVGFEKSLEMDYDILVHCTKVGMEPNTEQSLVSPSMFKPGALVMDTVYFPKHTKLLRDANRAKCICIEGHEMFSKLTKIQIQKSLEVPVGSGLVDDIVCGFVDQTLSKL